MKRPEFIARQSSCPSGLLGRLIGNIMAAETATANSDALRLLSPRPTDHVLEVGFGHGRTLQEVATAVSKGFVEGIDLSEEMLRMATRRNQASIASGRMQLRLGDSAQLPYPDSRFDRVYSVHTLYFWSDPLTHLREIARVMKPDGRFVLGFHPAGTASTVDFPASVYRFYTTDEVSSLLSRAGFDIVALQETPGAAALIVAKRHSI